LPHDPSMSDPNDLFDLHEVPSWPSCPLS
jgi:hypothetical protein